LASPTGDLTRVCKTQLLGRRGRGKGRSLHSRKKKKKSLLEYNIKIPEQ
jgi:hypothetical protein